jgi:HSP20 family protein
MEPNQSEQSSAPTRGNGQRSNPNTDPNRQGPAGEQAQRAGTAAARTSMQNAQAMQDSNPAQAWNPRAVSRFNQDSLAMMEEFSNELFRMFQSFAFPRAMPRWQGMPDQLSTWSPEVDVKTEQDQLKVLVDLPGLTKEQVKVDVDDSQIAIQGERREERTEENRQQRFRMTERRYGSFFRTVPLPDGANVDQAKANMKEGVLEITVPLAQNVNGRRLEIRA